MNQITFIQNTLVLECFNILCYLSQKYNGQCKLPHYYRRMSETPSKIHLSKLVSRIMINDNSIRRSSNVKQTNFIKYNRSTIYMQRNQSFRKIRPQRFTKHNNLVETNKENMMKLNTTKQKNSNFKTTMQSLNTSFVDGTFTPKREEEIRQRHNKYDSGQINEQDSASLEKLLLKNRMKSSRNLLGFNILSLEKKYNYSRFQLHTLYSIYSTLLIDSKKSLTRFKDSFEVMLNMNHINVRSDAIEKVFREQKKISFEDFIDIYMRIDQAIYKQSIQDYVQLLFQSVYNKDYIRFEDIVRILTGRITEKEAIDVATIIYEQYQRSFDRYIKLTEITELCNCCENFSKKIYRIYTRDMRCD